MSRLIRSIPLLVLLVVLPLACNSTPPSPLDAAQEALKTNDSAKAIATLEQAVADEPGSAQLHILLGQAYLRANRKDDAQKQFSAGFTLDKTAGLVLDSQDAEEYFVVGNVHATLGQFDQALAAYDTVLKLAPDKAGAYTNKGVVYYQQGKLDDAIGLFNKALEIDPADAETYYLLGAAQLQKEELPLAEQAFNKALELKSDLAPAYIGLGNVQLLKQNYQQAAATLEKALSFQPNSPEALYALGQAYAAVGRNDDAVRALTQCLQLNPPEPFRSKAQETLQQLNAH
jgi:cytochrome c-type biogenesis protein CcmH/NrfG